MLVASEIEGAVRALYVHQGRDPDLAYYTINTADGATHFVPEERFVQFHEHCPSEVVGKKRCVAWWTEARKLEFMLDKLGISIDYTISDQGDMHEGWGG